MSFTCITTFKKGRSWIFQVSNNDDTHEKKTGVCILLYNIGLPELMMHINTSIHQISKPSLYCAYLFRRKFCHVSKILGKTWHSCWLRAVHLNISLQIKFFSFNVHKSEMKTNCFSSFWPCQYTWIIKTELP